MTAITEITWPSGAFRWLDSEFPPSDAATAEAALKAAAASVWVGYGPAGWPAHPWTKDGFEAALMAGGKAVALAVGPLAPTGGSAWAVGEALANDLLAFLRNSDLLGKVAIGLDVEAQLPERNIGFAVDMAAEFLATARTAGQPAGVYGTWSFLAELHSRFPGSLEWAWGTGNAAANEALDSPPGYPADATPGRRADQFAWDVDVNGINCDLSVAQFEPEAAPVPDSGTAEPTTSDPAPADTGTAEPTTSDPAPADTGSPAPAAPDPASGTGQTFEGLPEVTGGETQPGSAGLYEAAVTLRSGQQLDVAPGPGWAVVIGSMAEVAYRGAPGFGMGSEGEFLLITTEPIKWAVVTQPKA